MDAFKEALKKKLQEKGKGPMLEIEMEMGKPVPDVEHADHKMEGDAYMMNKEKEESGLAPDLEVENYQGKVGEKELAEEGEYNKVAEEEGKEGQVDKGMMQQILSAIGDRGMQGRGPKGLAERAAMGAKGKLAEMKKIKK